MFSMTRESSQFYYGPVAVNQGTIPIAVKYLEVFSEISSTDSCPRKELVQLTHNSYKKEGKTNTHTSTSQM